MDFPFWGHLILHQSDIIKIKISTHADLKRVNPPRGGSRGVPPPQGARLEGVRFVPSPFLWKFRNKGKFHDDANSYHAFEESVGTGWKEKKTGSFCLHWETTHRRVRVDAFRPKHRPALAWTAGVSPSSTSPIAWRAVCTGEKNRGCITYSFEAKQIDPHSRFLCDWYEANQIIWDIMTCLPVSPIASHLRGSRRTFPSKFWGEKCLEATLSATHHFWNSTLPPHHWESR